MHQRKNFTPKQLEVEKWINKLGFRTQLEVPFGKYCVDILIPELSWAVEVDGPQHQKKRDFKRDQILFDEYKIKAIIRIRVNEGKQVFEKRFKECLDCLERKLNGNDDEKRP